MIRNVVPEDASAIAVIYNHYIEQTIITFETELIDEAEMLRRIEATLANGFPWIVKLWRKRIAYRASVESAVYMDHQCTGKGWGKELYERLLKRLQEAGNVHVVIGVISVPNEASVSLHRKLGFEDGGLYREVGRKFDRWIDVQMLQLKLDNWTMER